MSSSTSSTSFSSTTYTQSSSSPSSTNTTSTINLPSSLKVVGILLAITSGILIGSSFVFKKKGLLKSQAGATAGEGVAYLKSWLWWIGMSMMIVGEICNFVAYAFVEAIVVTPFGALAVVISAVLSSFFLNEKLTFFGWMGCGLCVLGSVIIALNGPSEPSVGQIKDFQKLFLAPGFLAWGGSLFAASGVVVFFVMPKFGKTNMIWCILVCSMIGGISVSVTTGLGAAIVTSVMGDSQFKYWFTYFLLGFVAVTLVTEVYYLNVALALFNTAMVTPTYYVMFTFCSMMSTIVLFKGLKAPATQIITLVMGFLVICFGITILQMSRVDPTHFKNLDRKSTILLEATRSRTQGTDMDSDEKSVTAVEDPGLDSLRGSFGTFGSIIRARSAKKMSISMGSRISRAGPSTNDGELRARYPRPRNSESIDRTPNIGVGSEEGYFGGLKRHQLYDAPMPTREPSTTESSRSREPATPRQPTIKFDSQDIVHSYGLHGNAIHEHRNAAHPPPLRTSNINDPFATPTSSLLATISPSPIDSFESLTDVSGPLTRLINKDSPIDTATNQISGHVRSASERGYPKGDRELDREESESLWHLPDSDEEMQNAEFASGGENKGGIRLVQKSRT